MEYPHLLGCSNSQELRGCWELHQASHLLFSTLDTSTSKIGFSKPLIAGLVGAATRKSEHSTRLKSCKQVWQVPNLGCFLKCYTTNCGIGLLHSTTDCASTFASLP